MLCVSPFIISLLLCFFFCHDGGGGYYDYLEGRRSLLSRDPERKSLRAIVANHTTRGTRDMSEKTKPIVPAVGGTNANTPADNPAYPVVLVKR